MESFRVPRLRRQLQDVPHHHLLDASRGSRGDKVLFGVRQARQAREALVLHGFTPFFDVFGPFRARNKPQINLEVAHEPSAVVEARLLWRRTSGVGLRSEEARRDAASAGGRGLLH